MSKEKLVLVNEDGTHQEITPANFSKFLETRPHFKSILAKPTYQPIPVPVPPKPKVVAPPLPPGPRKPPPWMTAGAGAPGKPTPIVAGPIVNMGTNAPITPTIHKVPTLPLPKPAGLVDLGSEATKKAVRERQSERIQQALDRNEARAKKLKPAKKPTPPKNPTPSKLLEG